MKIFKYPNLILRKKSKQLTSEEINNPKFKRLVLKMQKLMKKTDGAGLAAPQIGKNICLFAIDSKLYQTGYFINPILIERSIALNTAEEGCLSLPNIFGQVVRCNEIKIKFKNLENQNLVLTAEGLLARVIQQEMDHLDGVLFIDKMEGKQN